MSETMTYTAEQKAIVIKILKAKNFYEILDVPNDASVNDIKAAHKKLVLKVHPDKNHFPRAKEAFHAVRIATAVLLKENTRQEYDACLRSPIGPSAYKCNLSDEAVETILVTAGIAVVSLVFAAGVVKLVDWLTGPDQQENESRSSEENSE